MTASSDKTERVWDADTGRTIAVLQGHEGVVVSAVFSADGRRAVTASADMTARVWDARDRQGTIASSGTCDGGGERGVQPGWPARGDGSGQTARVWDAETGRTMAVL